MDDSTIFFQVQVISNQDPMMLGRIRAKLLVDNYADIVKSITDPPWNEEKDVWTTRDPFVFSPLMPYFMYQVPKKDEMAQVIKILNTKTNITFKIHFQAQQQRVTNIIKEVINLQVQVHN